MDAGVAELVRQAPGHILETGHELHVDVIAQLRCPFCEDGTRVGTLVDEVLYMDSLASSVIYHSFREFF